MQEDATIQIMYKSTFPLIKVQAYRSQINESSFVSRYSTIAFNILPFNVFSHLKFNFTEPKSVVCVKSLPLRFSSV
jgi:hypothetical protein